MALFKTEIDTRCNMSFKNGDDSYCGTDDEAKIHSLVDHVHSVKNGLAQRFMGRTTANRLTAIPKECSLKEEVIVEEIAAAASRSSLVAQWLGNCGSPDAEPKFTNCFASVATDVTSDLTASTTYNSHQDVRGSQRRNLFEENFQRDTLRKGSYNPLEASVHLNVDKAKGAALVHYTDQQALKSIDFSVAPALRRDQQVAGPLADSMLSHMRNPFR